MTRTVRRAGALDPVADFTQHIRLKNDAKTISARADKIKASLKKWLADATDVVVGETGSRFFYFDQTVTDNSGKPYKGMELRKSAGSSTFDEDKAMKIAERKGIVADVTVPVIDQDLWYRAIQSGKITTREADSAIHVGEPSWAFWPIDGEADD